MIDMSENIIKIYDTNNNYKDYKVLLTIEKDYFYVIYTDLENNNIKENLYAIKLKSLDSNDTIPIDDLEWQIIEEEYNNLLKEKNSL